MKYKYRNLHLTINLQIKINYSLHLVQEIYKEQICLGRDSPSLILEKHVYKECKWVKL